MNKHRNRSANSESECKCREAIHCDHEIGDARHSPRIKFSCDHGDEVENPMADEGSRRNGLYFLRKELFLEGLVPDALPRGVDSTAADEGVDDRLQDAIE